MDVSPTVPTVSTFASEVTVKSLRKLILVTAVLTVAGAVGVEAQQNRPSTPVQLLGPLPLPVSGSLDISGTPNVNVANTEADPAVVRDADNPARSPFQAVLCTTASFNGGSVPTCLGASSTLAVPSDRRLVIEYVAADCVQSNVNFIQVSLGTTVGGVNSNYPVHLAFNVFSTAFLEGGQQTRIYADPGSAVFIADSASGGALPGSVVCHLRISGHSIRP
jgi:hypothetical protein